MMIRAHRQMRDHDKALLELTRSVWAVVASSPKNSSSSSSSSSSSISSLGGWSPRIAVANCAGMVKQTAISTTALAAEQYIIQRVSVDTVGVNNLILSSCVIQV